MTSKHTDKLPVRPFDTSGFTPVHNAVFDVVMPTLSANAFKVLCVAIRQTLGWRDPASDDPRDRKEWDHVSYSQFMEKAGIVGRDTVSRALKECLERGYLLRRQPVNGDGEGWTVRGQPYYEYALNRDYELPIEEPDATGMETGPVTNGEPTGMEIKPGTGMEIPPVESVTGMAIKPGDAATSMIPGPTKQRCSKQNSSKEKHQQQHAVGLLGSLSEKQEKAYKALRAIGFQPDSAAKRYARDHDPAAITGWVRWARNQHNLTNPAALVRKRLDAQEPAPSSSHESLYVELAPRDERQRYKEWANP